MAEQTQIDWVVLAFEWRNHWKNHPPSYDMLETFHDFWNARGGRELYFDVDAEGNETPRSYLRGSE